LLFLVRSDSQTILSRSAIREPWVPSLQVSLGGGAFPRRKGARFANGTLGNRRPLSWTRFLPRQPNRLETWRTPSIRKRSRKSAGVWESDFCFRRTLPPMWQFDIDLMGHPCADVRRQCCAFWRHANLRPIVGISPHLVLELG